LQPRSVFVIYPVRNPDILYSGSWVIYADTIMPARNIES
jgi:hypothetical protein